MWWRRNKHIEPPGPVPRDKADEQGLNEAHEALEQALSKWPEVARITEDMRGIRKRNHFADTFDDALGGHAR